MSGIHINRQMQNRMTKLLESGSIKLDRNMTARQRLASKYAAATKSADTPTTQTVSEAGPSTSTASASTSTASAISLWSDPEIQRTIDSLSPEDRYKFSVIGEELYKKGGFMENVSNSTPLRKDPKKALFESAAQIQTMLRDGLSIDDLTDDEKRILVSVLGPDEAEEMYGISSQNVLKVSSLTENEQTVGLSVPSNPRTHKRAKKDSRRNARAGKTAPNRIDGLSKPI